MAGVAANEIEQAGAATNARPAAAAILDPRLFMAARRGDSDQLSELLRLDDGGQRTAGRVEHSTAAVAAATTTARQVVVDVDRRHDDAPAASFSYLLQVLDGVSSNEGDSLLHVVAPSGDAEQFRECAEMIYHGNNGLLLARNNKGDTPLHCAAGAGNYQMISCLVALKTAEAAGDETAIKQFLRMRNECGETALHHAVRAGSKDSIDELMSVDPELACIPGEGEEGASPLYLAISLCEDHPEVDIARYLLDKSQGNLSYSGEDGQNVLHAAVSHGQALPMLLEWFEGRTVRVQEGNHRHISDVALHSQLAKQTDKDGSTPLHLAASLEGWPDAKILSERFPNVWPCAKSAITQLIEANTCAVYQPDTQGLYPIHVAAKTGSLEGVKALLEGRPECATLRDGRGRTFLHVAVEGERYGLVEYACQMPEISPVLNVQDNNGDTALHRAVHVGNLPVFNCLVRNQRVRLNIANKDAMTPLDLAWCRIPSRFYYDLNPRCHVRLLLEFVGAPCGGGRPDLFSEKHIPEIGDDEMSKHLTNAAQVMGIVSVLVATVTFASAFTLPGGYQTSPNNAGTPLLAGSYAFDAFILSDTLAFICSCLATFSLIFVGVPSMDISIRRWYFEISAILLRSSGRSFVVAFALGLYLMLAPVAHATAIVICAIVSLSLLFGNSEVWQIIGVAVTARARLRTRVHAVWMFRFTFRIVFKIVLLHFWSFIIIFGLPALFRLGRRWCVHAR